MHAVLCLVMQSCLTLCDPMDCSPPGSSVCGILQEGILEWAAMPSSRGSSRPRDGTQVSHIAGIFFTGWATREACQQQYVYVKRMVNARLCMVAIRKDFSLMDFGDMKNGVHIRFLITSIVRMPLNLLNLFLYIYRLIIKIPYRVLVRIKCSSQLKYLTHFNMLWLFLHSQCYSIN